MPPLYGLTPRTRDHLARLLGEQDRGGDGHRAPYSDAPTWVKVTGAAAGGWYPGVVSVDRGTQWDDLPGPVLVAAGDGSLLTAGGRWPCTRTGDDPDTRKPRFRTHAGYASEDTPGMVSLFPQTLGDGAKTVRALTSKSYVSWEQPDFDPPWGVWSGTVLADDVPEYGGGTADERQLVWANSESLTGGMVVFGTRAGVPFIRVQSTGAYWVGTRRGADADSSPSPLPAAGPLGLSPGDVVPPGSIPPEWHTDPAAEFVGGILVDGHLLWRADRALLDPGIGGIGTNPHVRHGALLATAGTGGWEAFKAAASVGVTPPTTYVLTSLAGVLSWMTVPDEGWAVANNTTGYTPGTPAHWWTLAGAYPDNLWTALDMLAARLAALDGVSGMVTLEQAGGGGPITLTLTSGSVTALA